MALFYHYSRVRHEILEPSIGGHRHASEDPNVVNHPVVWLHNRELGSMEDGEGTLTFLHVVEVDESDPNLHVEKGFSAFMHQVEHDLGKEETSWRWYFYTRPLTVKEVRVWDGRRYV